MGVVVKLIFAVCLAGLLSAPTPSGRSHTVLVSGAHDASMSTMRHAAASQPHGTGQLEGKPNRSVRAGAQVRPDLAFLSNARTSCDFYIAVGGSDANPGTASAP